MRMHPDTRPAAVTAIPSADGWSFEHRGYDASRERGEESVFALTNGFLGVRASRDEGAAESTPALFIAGLYDEGPTGSEDLVIGPDVTTARILVDGRPLSSLRLVEHRRRLDMHAQTVYRRAVFATPGGVRVTLDSTWATSLARPHLASRALTITASAEAEIVVWVGATARGPHPILPVCRHIGSSTVAGTAVLYADTGSGVRVEAAISATAFLGAQAIPARPAAPPRERGYEVAPGAAGPWAQADRARRGLLVEGDERSGGRGRSARLGGARGSGSPASSPSIGPRGRRRGRPPTSRSTGMRKRSSASATPPCR